MAESLAILEWLEETHPTPSLLPTEPSQRTASQQQQQQHRTGRRVQQSVREAVWNVSSAAR